jgi:CHAT domain-containing protein
VAVKSFLGFLLLLCILPATAQEGPADLGNEGGHASQQLSLAQDLFLLGENQKALEAYRKARQLFLAAGDPLGQGYTWEGEADILFRLGEDQKALDAHENAKQLFLASRDQNGQGYGWSRQADILLRRGETTKALYAYRKARQLFLAVGDQRGQGGTWKGEADVLLRGGEHQKALDAYRKARQLFLAAGDHAGQGDTWLGEARALLQKGQQNTQTTPRSVYRDVAISTDFRHAAKAAAAAIANYQSAGVVPDQITAFLLRAYAVDSAPMPAYWLRRAPAQSASEAIAAHSQWRTTWITDRLRTEREEVIRWAYEILVPLQARQAGQVAEALRLAEEARSRVLLDLLAAPQKLGETISRDDLIAERQRLETEIWQIEEQLRGSPKLDEQEELRVRRLQLDQELEWNRYQRIAAQEGSLPQEPPLDSAAIQSLARDAGPLLLYYTAESEVLGFLIRPETAEIYLQSMAISRRELEQRIRALVHDLSNPLYERRAEAQAYSLWVLLIEPFIDRLPKSGPLVLVPHGPLHELPFEALRDARAKRLFERWQISVTPSASALAFARRRHAAPSPNDSFLGFSSGRGLHLPVEEVAQISGFFGVRQTTEANYRNYVDLLAQARHLLIATRGVHIEGSRSETYLELEPTPQVHDSRLTAAEIATIPLQAELVTLAACDTSHGRALLSDERLDLTRSFLIARAAAVLATRWKVPEDTATSQFLADFYRAYRMGGQHGTGMRKDEALTEARRLSRERGAPAPDWAAWVLVGDAR